VKRANIQVLEDIAKVKTNIFIFIFENIKTKEFKLYLRFLLIKGNRKYDLYF